MRELSLKNLQSLIHEDTSPCVTLYVPLNIEEENELINNSGAFKSLITQSEDLIAKQYSEKYAKLFLKAISDFNFRSVEGCKNSTIVFFKSPATEGFWIENKLLPGMTVVSSSFHVKPLIEHFLPLEEFLLIALNGQNADLYFGTSKIFEKVHTFESNKEKTDDVYNRQYIEAKSILKSIEKFVFNKFSYKDIFNNPIKKNFYENIDAKIRTYLRGKNCPVILAGNKLDCSLYLEANTCYQLTKKTTVHTSSVRQSAYLYEIGKAIAKKHYTKLRKQEINRIKFAQKESRLSIGLEEVFHSLRKNKVDTLFVNRREVIWGTAHWDKGYFTLHPFQLNAKDDDLIDDCLEKALELGVKIVTVDDNLNFKKNPLIAICKKEYSEELSKAYEQKKWLGPRTLIHNQ